MGERESTSARARRASLIVSYLPSARITLVIVGGLLWAGSARAVTLASLTQANPPSVVNGDKTFTNFTATPTGAGSFSINTSDIDVIPYTDPTTQDLGIKFQSASTGGPIVTAHAGSVADLLIQFDVLVQNPFRVHDLSLGFSANSPADGHAQVVETATFQPLVGSPIVVGQATVDIPQAPSTTFSHIDLTGDVSQYNRLHIVKDVFVLGGATADADVVTITQTFSQVPEPASAALLGLGSLFILRQRGGLARVVRRSVRGASLAAFALALVTGAHFARATTLDVLTSTGAPLPTTPDIDKEFLHFTSSVDTVNTSGTTVFIPSAIDVSASRSGNNVTLSFAGPIGVFSSITPGSKLHATIDFDIIVLDPSQLIDDAGLFFNPASTTANGSATIVETITSSGVPVATLTADLANPSVHTDFGGQTYRSLHVHKDITLNGGTDSTVTISLIQQTFSQVPEPASLGTLLLALPFVARRRTA